LRSLEYPIWGQIFIDDKCDYQLENVNFKDLTLYTLTANPFSLTGLFLGPVLVLVEYFVFYEDCGLSWWMVSCVETYPRFIMIDIRTFLSDNFFCEWCRICQKNQGGCEEEMSFMHLGLFTWQG